MENALVRSRERVISFELPLAGSFRRSERELRQGWMRMAAEHVKRKCRSPRHRPSHRTMTVAHNAA
jgi:hypothetical protein